ncbi:MAG: hypothetical protein MZV70_21385 [Desulfobacterales bacterium]|nr:hypothetical protein [Desulfobacterales bacterium]
MPNGYNGKILHVDLTKGELTVEEPHRGFLPQVSGRERDGHALHPARHAQGR